VSFVACDIVLSKGRWNYPPSPARVRRKLWRLFEDSLLAVSFHDPGGDNAIEAEVRVDTWETCERVSDIVFRAFLEWKPAHESMVEVEILRVPEGPFDDPFEPADDYWDEWDEWDGLGKVERVWR
jgi:hypothetical protein